jgi:hypothetical protein
MTQDEGLVSREIAARDCATLAPNKGPRVTKKAITQATNTENADQGHEVNLSMIIYIISPFK